MALTILVVRTSLPTVQLRAAVEEFQAFGGLNSTEALLFCIKADEGTKFVAVGGNDVAVVPYASMHETLESSPLL